MTSFAQASHILTAQSKPSVKVWREACQSQVSGKWSLVWSIWKAPEGGSHLLTQEDHTGMQGILEGTACGSHAPPVPTLPGCSYLRSGALSATGREKGAGLEETLPHDHTPNSRLTWVGNSALGDQFSEQNPKGPHIRLDGEPAVQSSFRGGPLDGEFGTYKQESTGYHSLPVCRRSMILTST